MAKLRLHGFGFDTVGHIKKMFLLSKSKCHILVSLFSLSLVFRPMHMRQEATGGRLGVDIVMHIPGLVWSIFKIRKTI